MYLDTKKLLLVYYHPVVMDLAQTFSKLGWNVTVAVNTNIKDNYGTGFDVLDRIKEERSFFTVEGIPLTLALNQIKKKQYNLVGCDGVFDGDQLVMDTCRENKIPFFNIQGYPNVVDEPSQNILSLGWFTPTIQYQQSYPGEGHKKQIDWKNVSESGRSSGKNICIFYPNFWQLAYQCDVANINNIARPFRGHLVSLIQRYEECNEFCYKAFKRVQEDFRVENLEGKPHGEVLREIVKSSGLLHLKWADQPGIAIFEAMLLSRPVVTMKSFVLASMNQEVLIDGYNAIVADSIDELTDQLKNVDRLRKLGYNACDHATMLTDFNRQKRKLLDFVDRCLKEL